MEDTFRDMLRQMIDIDTNMAEEFERMGGPAMPFMAEIARNIRERVKLWQKLLDLSYEDETK